MASQKQDLMAVRMAIEALDEELVNLIAERCRLASEAGKWKRQEGQPLVDPGQEVRVIRRAVKHARVLGVDEEGVRLVYWRLIGLSRQVQEVKTTARQG
jgi:chorismate mutase